MTSGERANSSPQEYRVYPLSLGGKTYNKERIKNAGAPMCPRNPHTRILYGVLRIDGTVPRGVTPAWTV
jgi:hypothetical protein